MVIDDDYQSAYLQIIMKKLQTSIEQKFINKGYGEDGADNYNHSRKSSNISEPKGGNRKLPDVNITGVDSDNESDWGLEDPENPK